ncbi:MAG TPA: gluconokinase [Dongiaceae bacterium]
MSQKKAPLILVLMGVSGCGKSTIGELLAGRLGWPMIEGDEFHTRTNIAKMREAIPLGDADRWPWLNAIASRLDDWCKAGSSGIVTCSALKRIYRDRLAAGRPNVWFIYLKGAPEVIRPRLAGRLGHFMPANLLDSQYAALEEPAADERAMTLTVDRQPIAIVDEVLEKIAKI